MINSANMKNAIFELEGIQLAVQKFDAMKRMKSCFYNSKAFLRTGDVDYASVSSSNKQNYNPWTFSDCRKKNNRNICFVLVHAHKAA